MWLQSLPVQLLTVNKSFNDSSYSLWGHLKSDQSWPSILYRIIQLNFSLCVRIGCQHLFAIWLLSLAVSRRASQWQSVRTSIHLSVSGGRMKLTSMKKKQKGKSCKKKKVTKEPVRACVRRRSGGQCNVSLIYRRQEPMPQRLGGEHRSKLNSSLAVSGRCLRAYPTTSAEKRPL